MEDFIVRKRGTRDDKWYMYIGFRDMRIDGDPMVNCFGSVLIRPDDGLEYCFNYSFHHSLDWRKVTGMILRPIKNYELSMEHIHKIAGELYYNIKEFVSKMN